MPHVATMVLCKGRRNIIYDDSEMPKTKASITRKKASEKAHKEQRRSVPSCDEHYGGIEQ